MPWVACFSYFASLTEFAGPSREASSLDSREKKVGLAPRSTGGSHGARSGCSEGWALGSRHSFIGLNSETEVHPKSCLGRALSSLGA